MERFSFKVAGEDKGLRLDQYIIKQIELKDRGPAISRARIQRLLKAGNISVSPACLLRKSRVSPACLLRRSGASQNIAKAHYKVRENDTVIINIPQAPGPGALSEQIPLEIVFEDAEVLVINKPAGMVTHPAVGNYSHTLVNALLGYGCPLSTINGPLRPGIVHRLDKDTSGLIVIAKNDFAHRDLAQQFQGHTINRKYTALVKGRVEHDQGVIDAPLGRHQKHRQKMAVSFGKSKQALTRYRVLKRYKYASLLELSPHTGRTHQLRVHLKFIGHPILGDTRYGAIGDFERLALHATVLGFRHPRTKEFVEFQSDIPQCFQGVY